MKANDAYLIYHLPMFGQYVSINHGGFRSATSLNNDSQTSIRGRLRVPINIHPNAPCRGIRFLSKKSVSCTRETLI